MVDWMLVTSAQIEIYSTSNCLPLIWKTFIYMNIWHSDMSKIFTYIITTQFPRSWWTIYTHNTDLEILCSLKSKLHLQYMGPHPVIHSHKSTETSLHILKSNCKAVSLKTTQQYQLHSRRLSNQMIALNLY